MHLSGVLGEGMCRNTEPLKKKKNVGKQKMLTYMHRTTTRGTEFTPNQIKQAIVKNYNHQASMTCRHLLAQTNELR